MAAPKVKKINLLLKEGFEYSTLGKALSWLLSIGRIVVIFTELVVIIAFLSRFWLDKTHTDLLEENDIKKSQVQSSSNFEKDFRSAQSRIQTYSDLQKSRLAPSAILKDLSALLPADVILSDVQINATGVKVEGTSLSESGLAGYIKALDDNKRFKETTLGDVSLKLSGQKVITFTISSSYEKAEKENKKETKNAK